MRAETRQKLAGIVNGLATVTVWNQFFLAQIKNVVDHDDLLDAQERKPAPVLLDGITKTAINNALSEAFKGQGPGGHVAATTAYAAIKPILDRASITGVKPQLRVNPGVKVTYLDGENEQYAGVEIDPEYMKLVATANYRQGVSNGELSALATVRNYLNDLLADVWKAANPTGPALSFHAFLAGYRDAVAFVKARVDGLVSAQPTSGNAQKAAA